MHRKANAIRPSGPIDDRDQRWVVVHDAERDHYELPIALAEVGLLQRFVTDWYSPLDRPLWQWLANLNATKSVFGISKRFRPELPSRLIADNKLGFLAAYLRQKLLQRCFLDEVAGGITGRHAASIANQTGSHLLAASYSAADAFRQLRPDLKCVLFQVHPHPRFLRGLYHSQMAKNPDYAGLESEPEVTVKEEELVRWEQESRLADHILCASTFTRRSLELSGIPSNRISVIPYGIDTQTFELGHPSEDGPVKVLYVGQKVARKGLRVLLRVWRQLKPSNATLILAGGHVRDPKVLRGFEDLFVETPRVGLSHLVRLFQEADLFVLPSLAEGFGHVYLEALSCGVPIICTENTGGADIIRQGESGWILPAGDQVALTDCLSWALSHRRQLREMRVAARAVAEKHSWKRFREGVRESLAFATAGSSVYRASQVEGSHENTVYARKTMLPPDLLASHSRLVDVEGHEALFRQMLGDVDEPTAPFGILTMPGEGDPIEEACVALGTSFARSLMAVATRTGVTAASLFHVAWAQVLARVSGREDVVFGTTGLDTPQRSEDAGEVGAQHARISPIRISVGEESVGATVRRTHEILLALRNHETVTPALAQRYSAVPAQVPLFSATLAYGFVQEAKAGYRNGLRLRGSGPSPNGKAKTDYPFTLLIGDLKDDLVLGVQAPASIDAMRVCRFASTALEQLVEALEQKPSAPICTLDVMPQAERRQVLCGWNETVAEFPDNHCIQELFEEQVRKTPHALAVVAEDRLDYAELNRRANQLAHYLREMGVRPDTHVAICVERGAAMIVAVMAVLKAGGAYVPLDPAYPPTRLKFMLEDCNPLALLTQRHVQGLMPGVPKTLPVLQLDAATCPWHNYPETDLHRHATGVRPMHLAYVIYTSGSTGTPKGVQVEHRGVCNLAAAQIRAFAVAPDSRILQFASFSFDACISEIMMTLCQGAALYCAPPGETLAGEVLNRIVAQYGITHVTLPPAVLSGVPEGGLASIRTLILAGEALADTLASRWVIGRQLINAYGPTEATVCATVFHYQAGRAGTPPIGRPIANTRVYILDRRGSPAPIGVIGELYIGGTGVARGYLNRPELTEEKFLPDPFTPGPGVRMYRTGDLGRWLSDGNIEFLGRDDFQVKIRGFRIELGEIEARLVEHPSVHEALVIVREDTPGDERLVAYYMLEERGNPVEQPVGAEDLRSHLFARLPEYMVPAAYVPLKAFPLTPNGKLNREALPVPDSDAYAMHGYELPIGETETILADLWVELLKLDRVGRNDSFFDLGGHSLLAVRMIERVRELFSRQLALVSFIQTPTISYLADLLAGHKGTQLATLNQGSPSKSPLIWVAPEPWQPHFTTYLSPDRPALSFAITEEELAAAAPTYRLKDLAACVVKGIRQARPNSSYILAGFCQTSLLAYECAQQLCKLGHEIPLLVMGDVMVPGHDQGLSFAERSKRRLEREAYYLSVMGRSAPSEWRRLLQLRVGGFRAMREHRTWVNLYQSQKKNTLVARELYQALIIAHLSYTPAPYHGRVLFIQSGERPRSDRWDNAASWGRLIDDLEVFDAPGDHTSLFREPHARFAANKLQLALDRVDQDDPFLTRCG